MNNKLIFILVLFSLNSVQLNAAIKLPRMVSDSMVLQRGVPVKIWGWANPHERISVRFRGKKYTAVTSGSGKWQVVLHASQAGGPYEIVLKGTNTVILKNILIGEVWLCSGQSNMEYNVSEGINNQQAEIAAANYPLIRLLKIQNNMSLHPATDVRSSGWESVTPLNVKHFSATAYLFGKELYNTYKVPIGLITASWGGTPIEAWVDYSTLKKINLYTKEVEEQEKLANNAEEYIKNQGERYNRWINIINKVDSGFDNGNPLWSMPGLSTNGWKTITVPSAWEAQGFEAFDGIGWLRKEITLPATFTATHVQLSLGIVDDNDFTYVNGELLGHTEGYNIPRHYSVPDGLLKAGSNTIAIRVFDNGGAGGIIGDKDSLFLSAGKEKISLAGEWKMKTSLKITELPPYPEGEKRWYQLCGMYNGMIAPTENYTIKGVIWYQGESNVRNAYVYRQLFPLMIANWRLKRGNAKLPFLYVQLPNIANTSEYHIHDTAWAPLRDAQFRTLKVPYTGMAVLIDDEGKSLHPLSKQLPAKRLVLLARKIAYGEPIIATGPLYKDAVFKKDSFVLSFNNIGSGMIIREGNSLKGFEIAGSNRIYFPASAYIVNNKVIVKSNNVKKPEAVRYDWANNPVGNLFNKEGFPASPFRTDDW